MGAVRRWTLLWTLLPAALVAGPPAHFDVQASFVPPSKPNANAMIAVFFTAKDADVRINEDPAPRLKLDPAQAVLALKPADKIETADPGTTRYLDLTAPVRFPVTLGTAASKGTHVVKASVAYFYCSKREGWCRKGTTDVEVPVLLK
jgi:hypothetical protein